MLTGLRSGGLDQSVDNGRNAVSFARKTIGQLTGHRSHDQLGRRQRQPAMFELGGQPLRMPPQRKGTRQMEATAISQLEIRPSHIDADDHDGGISAAR